VPAEDMEERQVVLPAVQTVQVCQAAGVETGGAQSAEKELI